MKQRKQMRLILLWVIVVMGITDLITVEACYLMGEKSTRNIIEDDFRSDTNIWSYSGNAYRDRCSGNAVFARRGSFRSGKMCLKENVTLPFYAEYTFLSRGRSYNDCFKIVLSAPEGCTIWEHNLKVRDDVRHDIKVFVDSTHWEIHVDGIIASAGSGYLDGAFGSFGFSALTSGYDVMYIIDNIKIVQSGISTPEERERSFEEKIELYGIAEKVPVLMYHHILMPEDKKAENSLIVTTKEFEEQMSYLYKMDYTTITTNELILYLDGKLDLPEKSVIITFDDGYQSNYIYAYPILKKYGFRASIALIPKLMTDEPREFNPAKMTYISWKEVEYCRDIFEYANHTYSHTSMRGIAYEKALEEIMKADDMIRSKCFVYPIGHTSQNSERVLRELGYELAFTTKGGYVTRSSSRLYLRRQRVNAGISLRAFKALL